MPSEHRKYLSGFKLMMSTAAGSRRDPSRTVTQKKRLYLREKLCFDFRWTISLNTWIANEYFAP